MKEIKLTSAEKERTLEQSSKLLKGLVNTSPAIHLNLIHAYIQEAVIYGQTGKWIIEEAIAQSADSEEE